MHQIAPFKKISGKHAPKPPSNGHGFAMRSMWLRDMQIPKSEKNNYCLPPPRQILATPLLTVIYLLYIFNISMYVCLTVFLFSIWTMSKIKRYNYYSDMVTVYKLNVP